MLDYIAFGIALWIALDVFIVLLLWLVRPRTSRPAVDSRASARVSPRPSPVPEAQPPDAT
jgi:hypothetical protein